ncbi:MAG: hypothetical protein WCP97_00455 [bacterium]
MTKQPARTSLNLSKELHERIRNIAKKNNRRIVDQLQRWVQQEEKKKDTS